MAAKKKRQAIGYCRVSLASQVRDGVSLEAQECKLRDWCALHDYTLVAVKIDAGLSGGRADNRPALQEALQAVGRGDALIVYSLSRLARSTKDTLAISEVLDRKGSDLVSVSESIDTTSAAGKMVFRMLAVLAEFERDTISERTSMVMRHLLTQSFYVGGRAPMGWAKEGNRLVAVSVEQETLRLVAQMRSEGRSLREISRALEAKGIVNRVGQPFSAAQVRRMVVGNRPSNAGVLAAAPEESPEQGERDPWPE